MSQTVEIWLIGTRRGKSVEWDLESRGERFCKETVRIRRRAGIPAVLRRVVVDVDKLLAVASRDQVAA